MALKVAYDTESNGFLHQLDRLHSITLEILGENECWSCCDHPEYEPKEGWQRKSLVDGLQLLERADLRIAHNAIRHDEPAIKKVYPWFDPKGELIDTLILSKLVYPEISRDGPNPHKLPPRLRRSHALKPWGMRLGTHKKEYDGGWDFWTPEMQDYAEDDIPPLVMIFRHLMAKKPNLEALRMEQEIAVLAGRQERRGFTFDFDKALALKEVLQAREKTLETSLIDEYGEWWEPGKVAKHRRVPSERAYKDEDDEDRYVELDEEIAAAFAEAETIAMVPKTRRVKMAGFPHVTIRRFSEKTGKELKPYVGPPFCEYEEGAVYTPIKRVQFNPGSRSHVRKMLYQRHGWKPTKFTKKSKQHPKGQPVVDDDVLRSLPFPEAQKIADYYLVLKRLGQLATGKNAWIKLAVLDEKAHEHRIHGQMDTIGTVTFRCAHFKPNMGQVVSAKSEYGFEMRSLFMARRGTRLVGYDGSSLQLRLLAHYLARYDDGNYITVVTGPVSPHVWAAETIGRDLVGGIEQHGDETVDVGKEKAKRVMYANLFGAGPPKIGSIILPHGTKREREEMGAAVKERISVNFHGMAQLEAALHDFASEYGYLPGLDGRHLAVRKLFAALNTLLMSAEAILMKRTKIEVDRLARDEYNMEPGRDYEFVGDVHDEHQVEVRDDTNELSNFSHAATRGHELAGQILKLRCPMKAEVKIGATWAETH